MAAQFDGRHVKEGLSEDEKQKVKLAAKTLLHRLLEEHPKVLGAGLV